MEAKGIISIIGLMYLTACAVRPVNDSAELKNFRNYVLGSCLGAAFSGTDAAADLNKALIAYMELGNMPLEAYQELRELNKVWLEKDYSSKHGRQVNSMKCFDMYNSAQVLELYKKYDPCKLKDAWMDRASFEKACAG
jgi:hypothetical protein